MNLLNFDMKEAPFTLLTDKNIDFVRNLINLYSQKEFEILSDEEKNKLPKWEKMRFKVAQSGANKALELIYSNERTKIVAAVFLTLGDYWIFEMISAVAFDLFCKGFSPKQIENILQSPK